MVLTFFFPSLLQTVVGADIADLLLEGHEPSSLDYSRHGLRIGRSREDLLDDSSAVATTTGVNRSVIGGGDLSVDDVTDRFRNLLLHGQKKVGYSSVNMPFNLLTYLGFRRAKLNLR